MHSARSCVRLNNIEFNWIELFDVFDCLMYCNRDLKEMATMHVKNNCCFRCMDFLSAISLIPMAIQWISALMYTELFEIPFFSRLYSSISFWLNASIEHHYKLPKIWLHFKRSVVCHPTAQAKSHFINRKVALNHTSVRERARAHFNQVSHFIVSALRYRLENYYLLMIWFGRFVLLYERASPTCAFHFIVACLPPIFMLLLIQFEMIWKS